MIQFVFRKALGPLGLGLFLLGGLVSTGGMCTRAYSASGVVDSRAHAALQPVLDSTWTGLAHSPEWRTLLHFRVSMWGADRSEADGAGFFLHPKGKQDAEAELREDAKIFLEDFVGSLPGKKIGPLSQRPSCAFPARARFVLEKIFKPHAIPYSPPPCPEFTDWFSRFGVRATLVYAAPYLGDPSSMFGHTFLRIEAASRDAGKNDLLDPTFSFEAITGADGGPIYALKGLAGGYPGTFTQAPFSRRVSLYTDTESRELWEYELPFSAAETKRLLEHAWELGTTHFDYYFFDENCSYHLLSLLEAAKPGWDLRKRFPVKTVPADTLRVLPEVRSIRARPSLISKLRTRIDSFSDAERERFFELKEQGTSGLRSDETAPILDALLDWEEYRALNHRKTVFDSDALVPKELLLARARVPHASSPELKPRKEPPRPDLGHPSSKLSLYGGHEKRAVSEAGLVGFELRPVLHDFMDDDAGFLPRSSLQLGLLRVEALSTSPFRVRLDEFRIAEASSLAPYDRLEKRFAWTVSGGLHRPRDTGCLGCVTFYPRVGYGISSKWIYALALAEADAGGIPGGVRGGPGAAIGSFFSLGPVRFWPRSEVLLFFPRRESWRNGVYRLSGEASIPFRVGMTSLEARGVFEATHLARAWDMRSTVKLGWYF